MSRIQSLVIGGSGYVGSHLIRQLDPAHTVQAARRPAGLGNDILVDLAAAPLPESHSIFDLAPEVVWCLGRPPDLEFELQRQFHSNLQRLMLHLASTPELRAVHLSSSTLVYSGKGYVASIESKAETEPHSLYEYFKLETELFMECLSRSVRRDVEFTSWRLPVMFGGTFSTISHGSQFIYWFIQQYALGHRWEFDNEAKREYGTSWAWVEDLAKKWASSLELPTTPGFHIRNVSSGFFTYSELHDTFVRLGLCRGYLPLRLHESRCEVIDDAGMPQIEIGAAIIRALRTWRTE